MKLRLMLILIALPLVLAACSDGSDSSNSADSHSNQPTAAQQLLGRFGDLSTFFTEAGMQGLIDYEDTGNPVTLLQLMSVTDLDAFQRFDEAAGMLWESVGAEEHLRSEVFEVFIGDRSMSQTRVLRFPNANALLSAIDTPAFTDLMNTLATASDDHAWVLGEEIQLPFESSGSYVDPALQNIDAASAVEILSSSGGDLSGDGESFGVSNPQAVIDMIVSDQPGPFWMVNLIDFYEQANFPDGRDTDLTGEEANTIYGNAIVPDLLRFNSSPQLTMPVLVTLTDGGIEWEQAAIVRYASRDAFLNAFVFNPGAGDKLIFKDAGVENTQVFATQVPGTAIPAPESGLLFNFRYCEVLLVSQTAAGGLQADVYNSMPLNTCPPELWSNLDAEQIRSDYGVSSVALNGLRYWVLDLIVSQTPLVEPVIESFGGIDMRLAATVEIAVAAVTDSPAYLVNRVSRDTVFHYVAGRQVYELEDPDGIRYRMQSFTQGQDPDQQLVDLQRLGSRLTLPSGWSFHVEVQSEDFALRTVAGIAEVITDDLGNTYQRIP
ncbi:MAG: DUF1330 domain-containing protein [Pseudomonadota bacterium]